MLSKRRAPLTRKEKSFFLLTALLCAGVVIFAYMSAMPLVKVEAPAPLPAVNAYSFYKSAEIATRAKKAPVDALLDLYAGERTVDEKTWLYSLARRKAWLKTNENIGISIRKGMALPYRNPLKNWDDYYLEANVIHARMAFIYKEVEARTFLKEGQTDKALDDALDLIQIAGQLTHGGITRGRLEEAKLIQSADDLIQESLETASTTDLQRAIQRLNGLMEKRESYSQAVSDRRNRDLDQILKGMSGRPNPKNDNSSYIYEGWSYYYWYSSGSAIEKAAFKAVSKHNFIEAVEEAFKAAQLSSREPYDRDTKIPVTWYIRPLKWGLESSRFKEAENLTKRRFLLLVLALRLFEKQHGKFPEKLSALSPQILKSLPSDPFSLAKSTFCFKRMGDGYLLYSVGRNNFDNGGRYKPTWDNWVEDSETSDLDDVIYKRQILTRNKIPSGTKPKKPAGKSPLFPVPINLPPELSPDLSTDP